MKAVRRTLFRRTNKPPTDDTTMAEAKYTSKEGWEWIDCYSLSDNRNKSHERYIEHLAEVYDIHPATIKDCLTPHHLPKAEVIGDIMVIIMRYVKEEYNPDADTMQSMTNKLVILSGPTFVVTLHKGPFKLHKYPEFFKNTNDIIDGWTDDCHRDHLLNSLLDDTLETYRRPLPSHSDDIDRLEKDLAKSRSDITKQLYNIRRQLAVLKKMLQLTKEVIRRYLRYRPKERTPGILRRSSKSYVSGDEEEKSEADIEIEVERKSVALVEDPFRQDLKDTLDALQFEYDSLHENTTDLLNLYLALGSHRTNNYVAVLAVFTAFFVPVTFLAGVWGMNFDFMPELHYKYGYLLAISSFFVSCVITGMLLWCFGVFSCKRTGRVEDDDDVL